MDDSKLDRALALKEEIKKVKELTSEGYRNKFTACRLDPKSKGNDGRVYSFASDLPREIVKNAELEAALAEVGARLAASVANGIKALEEEYSKL